MLSVLTLPTLAEASAQMTDRARYLAGGTLVMRDVNYGDQSFDRIVRVTDSGLKGVSSEGGRLVIGAGVTMAEIIAARELDFLAPVARVIGGPAVRAMATVGGNLYAPHPYGDLATALLALDGAARLADGGEIPLEQLFQNRMQAGAAPLVRAVAIERPSGDAFRFRKVSRTKPKGAAVMAMAAHLKRSAGRLADVRVAYGAMGPTPVRVPAVERALEGAALDANGIAPALAAATDGLSLPDDALASAWYRQETAPVHLRRLLLNEGS